MPIRLISLCRVVVGAVLCAGASATAVPIPIANPGFEANFAADGTFPVGDIDSWPAYDPLGLFAQPGNFLGVVNPTGTSFFNFNDAPEGRNAALLFFEGTIGQGPIGIRQPLDAVVTETTTYTLTVEVVRLDATPADPACNQADLAEPCGVLDLADIGAFVDAFQAGGSAADLNVDTLIDLGDISVFVTAFTAGCSSL